jgi:hypothetical protein
MAKGFTKANARKEETLNNRCAAAMQKVYESVDNNITPFHQCMLVAPEPVKAAYREAIQARIDFYSQMIAEGRGYYDSHRVFRPY